MKTYRSLRSRYGGVASQLVIEATSQAWAMRRNKNRSVKRCAIRFDWRLFRICKTERGNPLISLRGSHVRIGLPISVNGAYTRLREHLESSWRISSIIMRRDLRFLAVLEKEDAKQPLRQNWLGVDINSSRTALTVIFASEQHKTIQLYLGRDLARRITSYQNKIALLRSYRDTVSRSKSGLKLRRLSKRQHNYTSTRVWQVSNRIVQIALRCEANVAIEHLRYLTK
jgi:hypothetical protein